MKGMILAAGYGTRLRPLTWQVPKPMIPVGTRPLLAWAVAALTRCGIREIAINLHHRPDVIRAWLDARSDGIHYHLSYEPEILGTAGGVREAKRFLADEPFFLLNGDTVQFPPLDELENVRREQGALAALLLRPAPESETFTRIEVDGNRIRRFGGSQGRLMFAGCHAISPAIFDRIPPEGFSGLTEDVYVPVTEEGGARLACVVRDGVWFDVGTPGRYMEANDAIRRLAIASDLEIEGTRIVGDSLVHESARIEGEVVRSVIGSSSVIERGAVVRDSVIWDRCEIPRGATVDRAVVATDRGVEPGVSIANEIICDVMAGADYGPESVIEQDHVRTPL